MTGLLARLMPGRGPRKARHTRPEITEARERLKTGDLAGAEQLCNGILTDEPEDAEALNVLGGIALQAGRPDLAVRHFMKATALDPAQPAFHQGLGIAYFTLRQYPDAFRCLEQAAKLDRRNPAARNNLGNCYKQAGRLDEAIRCYRKAISVESRYLPAYINLADLLGKQRKRKAAVRTYRKALRLAPDTPENQTSLVLLHYGLGLALRELDQTDEAIACYQAAIDRQPDFALAHNSLGGAYLARNELDAALRCFRRALELEPGYSRVHSNILLTMNYLADCSPQDLYLESLQFNEHHARSLFDDTPFRNSRSKKKILKVGYLSPDFREHSVAHFTRKLFGQHNRENVTIYAYSDVEMPDDFTGQFRAQSDHWLSIAEMIDAEVATRIREDGIDILVDLTGHTSNNRLLVFARKPAPVLVNWLGYPNTTGMQAMDYRLTDAVADPPGDADRLHTERLVRLDHGFLCYQTDDSRVPVAPAPSLSAGHVTFGSFNMIRKVTPEVIRMWARVLESVPGSRLLMKSNALEDGGTRARLLQAFADHGIGAERIELVNAVPRRRDHMAVYSRVDIGLDPFPYNGTTTTFEALWMGVPVVCLHGDRHAARVGASIMQHLGLPELVANSEDDYVEVARGLAADTDRRVALRKELRNRLSRSPLMDVAAFTESLENAYRTMWTNWCDTVGRRK